MSYKPSLIDTTNVVLPEFLTERLAEHIHDVWAQRRRAEGWTYGPDRDDSIKTHLGLVPYAEMAEQEKEYNRLTIPAGEAA